MFDNKTEVTVKAQEKQNAMTALVSSLIRLQHSLYKKEMADWVLARNIALDLILPRRYDIVQFYRDIETDLFIKGQVNQRINRIKNRKFKIVNKKTGEVDEDKTKLLQKKWFRQFIRYAMESKFHGYSLIYFTLDYRGNPVTKLVWREHVKPEKNMILKAPFDAEGERYDVSPYSNVSVAVGDPYSLGMYAELAQPYILRKHSWASWDEFEELFGVPLRWINTDSTDRKILDQLENFAITMGSSNYAIVPGNAKMEVKEGQRQDAFAVFNEKRKGVNEEVALYINGTIETSTGTGSRAKATEVLVRTQDEITLDDKQDMADVINDDMLPVIASLFKYPFTEDDEFVWDDTQQLAPKDRANVYKVVSDMGFELDQEDVSKNLNVVITGKKEPIAVKPITSSGVEKKKRKGELNSHTKAQLNVAQALIEMHTKINELHHV
jgi:phage gp29-like protein